jgi:alkylation response protein AidB-like acyl-CoA dehydrogenase
MLQLDDEQEMVAKVLKDIAENEFADDAFTWEGETPWANLETLAEQGLLGINLPEEYGGGGMGEFEAVLSLEIIGTVCPDTAYALFGQSMVAPRAVEMFGTEAAKERYLPPVCNAESALAIAISEPDAGSDAGAISSTVEEADDGTLYLNGEKIWVSYVPESTAAVVWARFPDDTLGTVIMDFDAAGVEIGEHYTNMAGQTQTHFFMEDVEIPEENVLVRGKPALKQQLQALNWERCGSAAQSNATARCALNKALEYADQREQFGQSIADFQGMRWKLADAAAELEASRSLTYRAVMNAEARDEPPSRLETCIAKLYSARMGEEVVSEALQTFGATGYQQDHPLEYLYRMQRGRRLGGGTDEIMKNNVADVLFDSGLSPIV